MGASVHTITLGFDNVYVLKDKGVIMIDSGDPKKGKTFLKGLEKAGINPNEIQLIILTHGHWDHIGSAAEIKAATGAKIAMHSSEAGWLENSLKPLSPGVTMWGRVLRVMHRPFLPFIDIPITVQKRL